MPASNFDFLADTDPELHDIATSAEALLHTDPVACLTRLRAFAEQCTKTYVREQSVPTHWIELTQFDRLERLEATKKLSRTILNPLHKMRRAGNAAVHNNEGTLRDAKQQLRDAHKVAIWVYTEVHNQSAPNGSYRMPEPPSASPAVSPPAAPQPTKPFAETETKNAASEPVARPPSSPGPSGVQHTTSDRPEQGPGIGARTKERVAQAAAGFQQGVRNVWQSIKQGVARARQGIQALLAWIYNGIRAFFSAVWRGICAIGRFIKRVLKWTTVAIAIGLFFFYVPTIYGTVTGWLPAETQEAIPAVEAVQETHERVLPPESRTWVKEQAAMGWETAKMQSAALWEASVVRVEAIWQETESAAE
ncbi:MAG: DUF4145 domain-containing protein [Longimonas sp.]|uniref:DUF4145 domain-containing protein n=1 Tax=Longimonas sp. TaxID=2039626 RepID=UPI003362C8A1